ncbi:hypothetical protein EON82_19110 [bacterium]|nr:MAG: hypothetical protein EON82_19110 [bacterium]
MLCATKPVKLIPKMDVLRLVVDNSFVPFAIGSPLRTWSSRLSLLGIFVCASVPAAQAQWTAFTQFSSGNQSVYRLLPGDEINVTVLKHPEFSGDYFVPLSGTIEFPAVGQLQVVGSSTQDLGQQIAAKLRSRLLRPEVAVRLKASRAMRIYVLGNVENSGAFDMRPGWGIAESLAAAGGLAANVERKDVRVTLERAATKERVTMTLEEALSPAAGQALKVAPGDILRIDKVGTLPVT